MATMRRALMALVVLTPLAVSGGADAHHSYTAFFDHFVLVEGTLQGVLYANPHTILTLRTKDGVTYTGNWRAAFQLSRMGVEATSLKIGDVVVLSGTPSRDVTAHQLARLREVRRPVDGWTWRLDTGGVTTTDGSTARD